MLRKNLKEKSTKNVDFPPFSALKNPINRQFFIIEEGLSVSSVK
ncbi:MAG: hypothetical protein AAGG68_19585 [Bacteroidota bacterium]